MPEQPPRRQKVLLPPEVAEPPISNPSIASAFRALRDGVAQSHQQRLCLEWLMQSACMVAQFPYHASERDTAFALGRRFVGEHILKFFVGNVEE